MADVIENRVVELGFDNKNFEQNARTSIATLGKLDEALQFKGVASGFRSIQNGLRYIDFSPITSSLSSVQNAFTNIGAAIKVNFFDMLGNEAIRLGKSIVDNTLGQIKSGGLSRALNIEQAQFKVKGLKGDWDKIYEDMDYAVSGTAYGIDEAASAAAQFLASGVKTGDNMKAALRGISGIAAMASADYSSIADIFTAAAGKGKVQAMELQRIALHGINATAELAKALGKTEEEIRNMASKGEIDFNTFAKAMDDAFGEHAKAANETYTGSLSNVRAALSRIGEIWYEPWIHGLIPIFNELRLSIDKFKNALKKPLNQSGDTIATQLKTLMETGSKLVVFAIDTLNPWLDKLPYKFAPLLTKMKEITEGAQKLSDIFEAFHKQQKTKDPFDPVERAAKRAKDEIHDITEQEKIAAQSIMNTGKYNNFTTYKEFKEAGLSYLTIKKYIKELNKEKEKNKVLTKEEQEEQERLSKITEKYSFEIGVLNRLYDIFGKVGNTVHLVFEKLAKVFDIAQSAWRQVFPKENLSLLETIIDYITNIIKKFEISGERAEYLRRIFVGLFSGLEFVKTLFSDILKFVEPFLRVAAKGHPTFLSWLADLGDFIMKINNARQATGQYPPLLQSLLDMGEMIFRTIRLVWQKLVKVLGAVKEAFQEVWAEFRPENSRFPDLVTSVTDLIRNFKIAGPRAEALKTIFKGFFSALHAGFIIFKEFKEFTESIFASIFGTGEGDESKNKEPVILQTLAKFSEWIHQLSLDIKKVAENGSLFDVLYLIFTRIKDAIKNLFTGDGEKNSNKVKEFFDSLHEHIKSGIEKAVAWLKENKPIEWIFSLFEDVDLSGIFGAVFDSIGKFFHWISDALNDEDSLLSRFISTITDIFGLVADVIKDQIPNINMVLDDIFDFIHRFFTENPEMADKAGEFIIQLMDTLITVMQVASETLVAIKDPLIEVSKIIVELLGAIGNVLDKWLQYAGDNPEKTYGAVAFFALIWILNRIMAFLKTTELVTFSFALRRIYNSISMFFSNFSTLAYRASQLMWAKELSTIATAILKVAVALAIIGAVIGYHNDKYSGLNAGIGMLVVAIVAIYGFLAIVDPMKEVMELGALKLVGISIALTYISSAILVLAIAFSMIMSTIKRAKWWQTALAIVSFVILIGSFVAVLNELMLLLPAIKALQIVPILVLGAFLILFSAAVLVLAVSIKMLMTNMRLIYRATGNNITDTMLLFAGAVAAVILLVAALIGLMTQITTIKDIPWGGLLSIIVMAGVFIAIINTLSLIIVALETANVTWYTTGIAGAVFGATVLVIIGMLAALPYIIALSKEIMKLSSTGLIITFAMLFVMIKLLISTLNDFALVTVLTKRISPNEIDKFYQILIAVAGLFVLAAGFVAGVASLSTRSFMQEKNAGEVLIAVLATFYILVDAMKTMAKVAIMMQDVGGMDIIAMGDIFWSVVLLFGAAIGAVAALTALSKKNLLSGELGIILGIAAVTLFFKNMMLCVTEMVGLALILSKNNISQKTVDMAVGILDKLVVMAEWLVAIIVVIGAVLGVTANTGTLGASLAIGIGLMAGSIIIACYCIVLLAKAIASLGEVMLKYAKVWPDIKENLWDMLDDLPDYVQKFIENACKAIVLGIPAILGTIYIVFIAINAFLALIAPAQAAMWLLAINAMLDVMLIGADAIIIKLFILLDILLWALDSQAEIIGYEITMIVVKALFGAVEALADFFSDFGESMSEDFWDAYNDSWLGAASEWLSDFFLWCEEVADTIKNGELFTGLIEEDPDKVKSWAEEHTNALFTSDDKKYTAKSQLTIRSKDDYMKDVNKGVSEARKIYQDIKDENEETERTFSLNQQAYDARVKRAKEELGDTGDDIGEKLLERGAVTEESMTMYNDMKNASEKAKDAWKSSGDSEADSYLSGWIDKLKSPGGLQNLTDTVTGFLSDKLTLDNFASIGNNWGTMLSDGMKEGFNVETVMNSLMPNQSDIVGSVDFSSFMDMDWAKSAGVDLNNKDLKKALGKTNFDFQKYGDEVDWSNPDSILSMYGADNVTSLDGTNFQALWNNQWGDLNQNVEVNAVDPQIEMLIENLKVANERIDELNKKVESSIILPKDAKINITTEIDGDKLASKTYAATNILSNEDLALQRAGVSTGGTTKTKKAYWGR